MVYSGAVSKTGYQIGFTKALLRHIDRSEIALISGSSMGMLCGYSLSANKLDAFEAIFRSVGCSGQGELLRDVLFHKLLSRELSELLSPADRLEIPFAFPVCYIPVLSVKYYWLLGEYNPAWKRYIRAAMTFPFLCVPPSFLHGRLALDGGTADNIPLYPILRQGPKLLQGGEKLDLVLVLHFDARYDYRSEFETDVPVLDLDLAICNDFKKNHYDFSETFVTEMIGRSEEYGDRIGERLFAGDCSRESLNAAIERIFLDEYRLRRRNLSADRLVSMFNFLGKAFRSEASCNKFLY